MAHEKPTAYALAADCSVPDVVYGEDATGAPNKYDFDDLKIRSITATGVVQGGLLNAPQAKGATQTIAGPVVSVNNPSTCLAMNGIFTAEYTLAVAKSDNATLQVSVYREGTAGSVSVTFTESQSFTQGHTNKSSYARPLALAAGQTIADVGASAGVGTTATMVVDSSNFIAPNTAQMNIRIVVAAVNTF